jgi:polyhydroxybutyrate depolymerase
MRKLMRSTPLLALLALLTGCASLIASQPTPTPTAMPSPSPSATHTLTPTLMPTPTPTPTPAPTPTATSAPTQLSAITPPSATSDQIQSPGDHAKYQEPGDYLDMLMVDGYRRWFTVHIPPGYQPDAAVPLVFNIHGYTGTMFAQEEGSQMKDKADEEGFVVVHPQALGDPPSWWGPLPGIPGQPDRDFFVELLAHLQQHISIDPARIYATGLSNGATMANTLGCEMADKLAAIAPVAGGHTDFTNCDIARPISVLVIHGTMDSVIPYHGRDNEVPPVHLWVEYWAKRNGCDPTPTVEQPQDKIKKETWQNCAENVSVMLLSRLGGDHIWPGSAWGEQREGFPADMNATDVIWEFFESHPKLLLP